MLIKKSQSQKHENSPSCTVWEYNFPSPLFSFATAKINGRYPDSGRAMNTECEEVYYVISGSGVLHTDKGDFELAEGDTYFFEKGEKYWVEGKDLFIALTNAPKWSFDQYRNIE